MAQNSEQIEAKLCAYLEGELDDAGRAEIEKHLQQNPAHRKLLAEVGMTRDLLRVLPREPAPPDICEAFQGQLERAALLGDPNDDVVGGASLKVNRWPQYFAVAAVVMLAAGLGLVVYFGLPSGAPQRHYAVGGAGETPASAPSEDGISRNSLKSESTAPTSTGNASPKDPSAVAATMPSQLAPTLEQHQLRESVALRGSPTMPGGVPGAENKPLSDRTEATTEPPAEVAQDLSALARRVQSAWQPEERERLFRSGSASGATTQPAGPEATREALATVSPGALCFVVSSASPGATSDQIARQLTRMEVAWAALPEPDAAALHSRFQHADPAAGAPTAAGIETTMLAEAEPRLTAPRGGETATAPAAPAVAAAPSGGAAGAQAGRSAREADVATGAKQQSYAAGVSAPPPATARAAPGQPGLEVAERTDTAPSTEGLRPVARSRGYGFGGGAAARPQTLFVARGLTREQAHALNVSLNDPQAERQVTVDSALQPSQVPATASTLTLQNAAAAAKDAVKDSFADDAPIRGGDALRMVRAHASGEQTVAELQVRPDGFATIPGIGDFRCEGLTLRQLQDRLKTDLTAGAADPSAQVVQISKVEAKAKQDGGRGTSDVNDVVAMRDASADRATRGGNESRMRQLATPGAAGTAEPKRGPAARPEAAAGSATAQASASSAPTRRAPAPADEGRAPGTRAATDAPAGTQPQRPAGPVVDAAGDAGNYQPTAESTPVAPAPATTAPADAAERFDVVILVQSPAATAAPDSPASGDVPSESQVTIQQHDILMVQFGEDENGLNSVRVGQDGNIELPNVGQLKAEGLSPAELQEQIVQKLRQDSGKLPDAKVSVKRVGPAQGDTPAPAEDQKGPAEPKKSDGPAAQAAPAGDPATDGRDQ
jgi:protein involved in polysaccharide export with SLBB domain